MKLINTVVLVIFAALLSGCFVESEKPLISQGQDIGVDANSYILENLSTEISLWSLISVENKANTHHYNDVLMEFLSASMKDKDADSLMAIYDGEARFVALPNRPNYYLMQATHTSPKETNYTYYLAHKQNDHLQFSFMKLNKAERKKATETGFTFHGGYSSGIKLDSFEKLVNYAHYWLEEKGNNWVSNQVPEKTLMDNDDDDRQFSFRILTQPKAIELTQQQVLTTFCLMAAGHPGDPEVQKIPHPNPQGVAFINGIEDPEPTAAVCRQALKIAPSPAVKYALARAYFKAGIYQPKGEQVGSLALLEQLVDEGYPFASNLLANSYLSGSGVAKDPQKALQILEQAPRHPSTLSTLGYTHLYGYFGKKDYAKAKALFEEAIELGSAHAMARLGLMYQYGWGVKKDEKKGFDLISGGASQGDPEAQFNLGHAYYFGMGVDKNLERAFSLYKKSAEAGYDRAMYSLGFMLSRGQGIEKHHYDALRWLKKGAELGNTSARDEHSRVYYADPATAAKNETYQQWLEDGANAGDASLQHLLGQLYETGRDQPQNNKLNLALKWYEKAAKQGYANAHYSKALLLLQRNQQTTEAIESLTAASDDGHQMASLKLGDIYGQGLQHQLKRTVIIKPDPIKAIHYYEKMAQQGNSLGYLKAGHAFLSGNFNGKGKIFPDKSKAVDYFRKAALAGNPQGQSDYAVFLLSGNGIAKNQTEALKWFTKAADQGHASAMFSIGVMYHYGNGVKQSHAEALRWYNKASAKKHPMAWNNIGNLAEKGLGTKQDIPNAIKFYQLAADKGIHQGHGNLARIWGTSIIYNKADDAIKHAKAAIKLEDKYFYHEYLAAAYALKGLFQDAIAEQATAIAMAARNKKSHSLQDYRLKQYREGKKLSCYNGVGKGCF